MAESRAHGRYRAPRMVSIVNPLVRHLLGAGLPFGPNVVLTVRGRSSGLPRPFPVAIIAVNGRSFIQSPFGEVNWVRNLRVHPDAVLARGRRREEVIAVELTPEESVAVLRAGLDRYLRSPLLAPLVRVFTGLRRNATDAEILDHTRGHPMFELQLAGEGE